MYVQLTYLPSPCPWKDANGESVLHRAVIGGSIELVDWLIERHNLNVEDWVLVSQSQHTLPSSGRIQAEWGSAILCICA